MKIEIISRRCPKCKTWLARELIGNILKIYCRNCNYVERTSELQFNDINKTLMDEIGYEPETIVNARRQDENEGDNEL